jgi:DNA-binding SARP family transcriptional activator
LGLRLLGPLEATVGGAELALGGARQRIVLAALALNANRVTPVAQLIDAVWSSSPPPTVRSQVQICISALRKLFVDAHAPWAIRTRAPGYLLEIAAEDLDSERFGALVATAKRQAAAGSTAEAATTLRDALGMWRGPALSGVPSDLVQRGAAQLQDARLAAHMERIRLDLALGRHEEIVGELTALVEEHPLRERLCELLMLALYRSGRQAEALAVARRTRSTLVEELAIEPGQDLRDLESRILNRDPVLDLPVQRTEEPAPEPARAPAPAPAEEEQPVPRRLPASIADFTGRAAQLAEIKEILTNGGTSPVGMRIIAIAGKGGVGKSTLAIRAAQELRETYPDGHLYADLSSPQHDGRSGRVLARFLRALGVRDEAIPEDLDERADMYRGRLASRRVLVVLDGATTEADVLPLLPGNPNCAVLVTSRTRMSGLSGAHLMNVHVFDETQSLEMLAKIVGAERVASDRPAAVELVDFCGGLPLALRIAAARLVARPHWRLDSLVDRLRNTSHQLDEFTHRGLELRSNIGFTYNGLTPQAQRLFRLLSLVRAPDLPPWVAPSLLDVDVYSAEEVLQTLVDAQLVDLVEYSDGQFRYRLHDLLRAYAQEKLAETETDEQRRAAVSRLLGAWLARAEGAHRKEYGGDFTILHGDAPRWVADGGDAEIDDPMDWWETERQALVSAVHRAAEEGLDELCWDLALTSVTLFEVKGYFDNWRETAELAHAAAERAGNRRGRAAMLYSLGRMHMSQKRLVEAEACFDSALEIFRADNDTHGSALVLRNAAAVDRMRGRTAAMLSKYDEALEKMRAVGDPVGEAHILRSMAKFWLEEGDVERASDLLDRALVCCQQVNYLRGEAQVVTRFAELYLETDQVDLAHQSLNRVLLIVRDIGDRIGEAHALYGLGVVRHRTGRLDNAETTLRHALSVARQVGERLIEGQARYALGEIELARGNPLAALTHLETARRVFGQLGAALWHAKTMFLLSDVHQGAGDSALATDAVAEALTLLEPVDSRAAARLRDELTTARSALVTDGTVNNADA